MTKEKGVLGTPSSPL